MTPLFLKFSTNMVTTEGLREFLMDRENYYKNFMCQICVRTENVPESEVVPLRQFTFDSSWMTGREVPNHSIYSYQKIALIDMDVHSEYCPSYSLWQNLVVERVKFGRFLTPEERIDMIRDNTLAITISQEVYESGWDYNPTVFPESTNNLLIYCRKPPGLAYTLASVSDQIKSRYAAEYGLHYHPSTGTYSKDSFEGVYVPGISERITDVEPQMGEITTPKKKLVPLSEKFSPNSDNIQSSSTSPVIDKPLVVKKRFPIKDTKNNGSSYKRPNSGKPLAEDRLNKKLFKQEICKLNRERKEKVNRNHTYDFEPQGMWGDVSETKAALQDLAGHVGTLTHLVEPLLEGIEPSEAKKIRSTVCQMGEWMEENKGSFKMSDLLVGINTVKDKFETVTDPGFIFKHGMGLSSLITFVGSSIYAIYSPEVKTILICIISGLGMLWYAKDMMSNLWGDIWNLLSKVFTPAPQGYQPELGESTISDVCSVGVTMLQGVVLSGTDVKRIPGDAMRFLSNFDRAKNSLEGIIKVCLRVIEFTVNYVRKHYLGLTSLYFTQTNNEVLNEYLKEARNIIELHDSHQFPMTNENFHKLKFIIDKGQEIFKNLPRDRESANYSSYLNNLIHDLKKLKDAFVEANFTFEGLRQEPVGILLRGGSGVGKSAVIQHLNSFIYGRFLTEEQYNNYKQHPDMYGFNRQSETEFWSGYNHDKLITYFDDWGQNKDVAGNPDNEFLNVIRAINEFPYNLHMDEINKKANTTFHSKFVICSTNLQNFDSVESVVCKEAIERRFDLAYTVVPKDEFCTKESRNKCFWERKFDISKLPNGELNVSSLNQNCMMFIPYNLKLQRVVGKSKTFDEVCLEVEKTYFLKEKWYKQKKEEVKYTAEKTRAKYYAKIDVGLNQGSVEPQTNLDDFFNNLETPKTVRECFEMETEETGFEATDAFIKILSESDYHSVGESIASDIDSIEDRIQICRRALTRVFTEVLDRDWMLKPSPRMTIKILLDYYGPQFKYVLFNWNERQMVESFRTKFKGISLNSGLFNAPIKITKYSGFFDRMKTCYDLILKKAVTSIVGLGFWIGDWVVKNSITINNLLKIFGVFAAIIAATKIGKMVCSVIKSFLFGNGSSDDNSVTTHQITTNRTNITLNTSDLLSQLQHKVTEQEKLVPQMAEMKDPNGWNIVKNMISHNCFEFHLENADGTYTRHGYILAVKGNLALMPLHFVTTVAYYVNIDPKYLQTKVKLMQRPKKDKLEPRYVILTLAEMFRDYKYTEEMKNSDLVLVRLPRTLMTFRDITKNFPTEKEIADTPSGRFTLVYPTVLPECNDHVTATAIDEEIHVTNTKLEPYVLRRGYMYELVTSKGDCGAMLVYLNTKLPESKIFGLHVAGHRDREKHTGHGIASTISREELLKCTELFAVEDLVEQNDAIPGIELISPESSIELSRGQFVHMYDIVKPVPSASKSSIVKSRLYGQWGPAKTAPARLRPFIGESGFEINPWDAAYDKYCTPDIWIDGDILNLIRDQLYDDLVSVSDQHVNPRLLTYVEAVKGIPGEGGLDSIPRNKSSGMPYVLDPKPNMKGRERFWGKGVDYDLSLPEAVALEKQVEYYENNIRHRKRDLHVLVDNLKDEKRPLDKVKTGQTRLFCSVSTPLYILYRKYFGAFEIWFKANCILNGSAIGVNPYSNDWDIIARLLQKYGQSGENVVGAGDYKRYDGSEKPAVFWIIHDIIQRWYGQPKGSGDYNAREILWYEITNSRHIHENHIFEWVSSLGSGSPLTSIINCLYNIIAFRYCFWIANNRDIEAIRIFKYHVYVLVMGDDNIFTVSHAMRDRFNEITLCDLMANMGLTYTTDLKGSATQNLRNLSDVTFLKRSFRFCTYNRRYVAPLNMDTILEMPYWTRDQYDHDKIVKDNVDNALRELTLHGRKAFDEYADKMISSLRRKYGAYPESTSYELLYSKVLNMETFW